MGGTSSASKAPAVRYLELYIQSKESSSTEKLRINVEFLWKKYSQDKDHLTTEEAEEFLLQRITKSSLKKVIEEGITKKNSAVGNVVSVPSPNWSEIHNEFVYVMFQEIDPEITNRLNQQQFSLALEKDWKNIINTSINQGALERQFIKRLRDTTPKKRKESEEKGTSTPKKPKTDKSEQSTSSASKKT